MGATPASHVSSRRYRRRILGWGAVALVAVFATGAAVALGEVEDDLETRATEAVEALNVDGVSVSFSGQDGEVSCAVGLADPEPVVAAVDELRGVRSVELDESCTASPAPEPDPTEVAEPVATTTPATTSTSTTTTTVVPGPANVVVALEDDPRFSVLAGAIEAEGLADVVAGGQPVTVFAPTDDAFALLGPNRNAALIDAEVVGDVVLQHVVTDGLDATALGFGAIESLDTLGGEPLDVDATAGLRVAVGSDSAFVVEPDIRTGDGSIIHVVDRVLLPPDLDVEPVAEEFVLVARYDEDGITLAGAVSDSSLQQRLLDVARANVAAVNVDDRLEVDAEAGATADQVAAVAELLDAVPTTLARGEVIVAADGLFVSGVVIGPAARGAIDAIAAEFGAVTALTDRPAATDDGETARLEHRLNEVVLADPIRFEPGSAELATGSSAVIDRLAVLAKSLGDVRVTVTGHTDSTGAESANLALSEERAAVVAFVLGLRGVPAVDLVIVGRGSNDPVLVDGVEDPEASRRVEFTVVRR